MGINYMHGMMPDIRSYRRVSNMEMDNTLSISTWEYLKINGNAHVMMGLVDSLGDVFLGV